MKKIKICFVRPDAYPVFNNLLKIPYGGAQVRSTLLSKWLAKLPEYDVSFVVYNYNQQKVETHHNVKVYKQLIPRIYSSFPTFTLTQKYLKEIFISMVLALGGDMKDAFRCLKLKVYSEVDADIYFLFGINLEMHEISNYLNAIEKKVVVFLISDDEVSEKFYKGSKERNKSGVIGDACWKMIQENSFFVTQNEYQSSMLLKRFGKTSLQLPNPIVMNDLSSNNNPKKFILWVGRFDHIKNPHLFIELSKQLEGYECVMILTKHTSQLSIANLKKDFREYIGKITKHENNMFLKTLGELPKNLKVINFVPIDEIETFFSRALIVVNTSTHEGFPNTFLQAGKYGVPVVTFGVNPDKFITRYKCGMVIENDDISIASDRIRKLLNDKDVYNTYSSNIKEYVSERHNVDKVIDSLSGFIKEITK